MRFGSRTTPRPTAVKHYVHKAKLPRGVGGGVGRGGEGQEVKAFFKATFVILQGSAV